MPRPRDDGRTELGGAGARLKKTPLALRGVDCEHGGALTVPCRSLYIPSEGIPLLQCVAEGGRGALPQGRRAAASSRAARGARRSFAPCDRARPHSASGMLLVRAAAARTLKHTASVFHVACPHLEVAGQLLGSTKRDIGAAGVANGLCEASASHS